MAETSRTFSEYYDEPIKITQLRHHAGIFKHKLLTGFDKIVSLDFDKMTNMCKIITAVIIAKDLNPVLFFAFCYYYILIPTYIDCNTLFKMINGKMNRICVAEHIIDDHSPLGAVIISDNDLSIKHDFISKLMVSGFMPTHHDIELNALILYDAIPNLLKRVIVLLLHNIDMLNRDIRVYIINISLHELRINNCPLI